nr:AAA family ATPase [uncultured Sellimonas sp.]
MKQSKIKKISVIGYSGCGKSTLSGYLSKRYKIPVLYLDKIHWLPGWKEQKREEEIKKVKSFLEQNDAWVIDGNYLGILYERRMEESDRIILLELNRFECLLRIVKRYLQWKGKTRHSMTKGCPEKIDFGFLYWVLYAGRTKEKRQRYQVLQRQYPQKVLRIRNRRELDALYREWKLRYNKDNH